jgi:hypothetical protein
LLIWCNAKLQDYIGVDLLCAVTLCIHHGSTPDLPKEIVGVGLSFSAAMAIQNALVLGTIAGLI